MMVNGSLNGLSIVMGVHRNGWFVMDNPIEIWMMTGGTPISGNLCMGKPSQWQIYWRT